MSFVNPSLLNNLGGANRATIDAESYGVVKVDNDGNILLYNRYESELAGVEPSFAEGRNFFSQVAPCSNNRLFFGKFKEGVASGSLNEEFKYTFTYKMKPTPVEVHLYRDNASQTNWIFVKKAA
jgi:photoactive yellow protein